MNKEEKIKIIVSYLKNWDDQIILKLAEEAFQKELEGWNEKDLDDAYETEIECGMNDE